MKTPPIVTPQEWEAARLELLVEEKQLTRDRDALAAKRRRMPWLAVEKEYRFEGPDGPASLLDLFDGRRQLIVYQAFFEPGVHGWPDHACVGCRTWPTRSPTPPTSTRATRRSCSSRAPRRPTSSTSRRGWLGAHPVVHAHRRLRRRLRRRRVARHQRLDPRRRPDLPHLPRQQPRRRDDGQHVELPRHHRARAPGGVEASPEGYPQTPTYVWQNWHDAYEDTAQPSDEWLEQVGRGVAAFDGSKAGDAT